MNVGEMFAGIGGFRLGLERANLNTVSLRESQSNQTEEYETGNRYNALERNGVSTESRKHSEHLVGGSKRQFSIVWANEWDKYACQIYRKNFGTKELVEGDIREVKTNDIPELDLLVGGFPCQSFSLAGKRKGISEARGTLFSQIVRVASAKRPRLLLLENVKGLLSSDNGGDFAKILRVLGNLGYLLEWQVLNSKWFLPQNRERVFIIGHLGGEGGQPILPIGSGDGEPSEVESGGKISATIDASYRKGYDHKRQLITYWKNSSERWVDEYREDCLALKGQNDLCRQPLIVHDRTRTLAGLGRNLDLHTNTLTL
jgi:DNA-cytosine methyltransferase